MSSDSYLKARNLTAAQATRVYDVLVAHVGAYPAEDDRASFGYEFTKDNPTTEYRFCGALGMGGKFRFPRMSVDCYPEDSTPDRVAKIADCNAALATLRDEFNAAA
jgi:hypothetical protein